MSNSAEFFTLMKKYKSAANIDLDKAINESEQTASEMSSSGGYNQAGSEGSNEESGSKEGSGEEDYSDFGF
jgi:hypothetical protein